MTAVEPPHLRPPEAVGKRISLALAVVVHLALAIFLFYGIRWQTKTADVIEVDLINPVSVPLPSSPPPETPAMDKPETKPEAPAPSKPDIVVKDKDSKPKPDPFKEQLKQETEKLNARKIEDSLSQELSRLKATEEAKAAATRSKAIANYISRIVNAIRPRIALPPDLAGHPEAVFQVTQLPSGEILNVVLKRSSGHSVLDANIERAILKSSPLPKPDQGDIFSRELMLTFRPLDD